MDDRQRPVVKGRISDRSSALLRAVSLFVAVVGIWLLVIGVSGHLFGPAHEDRLGHALRALATSALVIPVVYLACRYLDRRPWSELRLTSLREGWRPFLFGAVVWLFCAGIGLVLMLSLGWASVSFEAPGADALVLALYLPLVIFLYEALPEELIFRGYIYRNLSESLPLWTAVVGQAALFTLWGTAIGAALSVDRIILFFTFSLALGILRVLTGNLWASIGFHVAFQCVTQYLAAAMRDGFIRVEHFADLEVVAFWFFPIMLGGLALLAASLLRKRAGRRYSRRAT